jgi:hypothetical protein
MENFVTDFQWDELLGWLEETLNLSTLFTLMPELWENQIQSGKYLIVMDNLIVFSDWMDF